MNESMQSVSAAIGWTILVSLAPIAAIWILVQVFLLVVPRRRSNLRYNIMALGLVAMLAPPLLVLFQPTLVPSIQTTIAVNPNRWSALEVPPSHSEFAPSQNNRSLFVVPSTQNSSDAIRDSAETPTESQATRSASARVPYAWISFLRNLQNLRTWTASWMPIVGDVWFLGTLVFLARMAISMSSIRRLSRSEACNEAWVNQRFSALKLQMNLPTHLRLLISERIAVPMAIGWIRPAILIPLGMTNGFSPTEVELILAHELAHVRRYDLWINLFQVVIESVLFYHPCVWMLSRQIRCEREMCCDAIAATTPQDRIQLGHALLKIEQSRSESARLSAASSGGDLMQRMRALCQIPVARVSPTSFLIVLVLWSMTFLVPWQSAPQAVAQQEEPIGQTKTADGATVFRGSVVDRDHKPIPGATMVWGNMADPKDETIFSTDALGKFEFTAPIPSPAWQKGYQFLWIYAPGYNVKVVNAWAGPKNSVLPEIVLQPEETNVFQIITPEGMPAEHALVEPHHFELPNGVFDADQSTGRSGFAPQSIMGKLRQTADKRGQVRIAGCSAKEFNSIQVFIEGQSPQIFHFLQKPTSIRLLPTATIRGKVREDGHQDAIGRIVRVNVTQEWVSMSPYQPQSPYTSTWPYLSVTSYAKATVDEKGTFEIPGVMIGESSMGIQWPSDFKTCPAYIPRFTLHANEVHEVDIEIVPGIEIHGKVIADDTGGGIPDVRIAVDPFPSRETDRGPSGPIVTSDSQGEYRAYIPQRSAIVKIFAFDNTSWSEAAYYRYPPPTSVDIDSSDSSIELNDLVYTRYPIRKVLVRNEQGEPMENRLIAFVPLSNRMTHTSGTTDHNGIASVLWKAQGDEERQGDWVLYEKGSIKGMTRNLDPKTLPKLAIKQTNPLILVGKE